MPILVDIFAFLFAVFVLVVVHEYGHFWVAKRCGIKILCFSIGFGKALWTYKSKNGVEYRIALLPLGGYVKMLDEREMVVPANDRHLAFNQQPLWKRFLVVSAGPITNFILATLLFWVMFSLGVQLSKPIVGDIIPNSIAAHAGLQKGDELIGIDNHDIHSWQGVMRDLFVHFADGNKIPLVVRREGHLKTLQFDLANWHMNELNPDLFQSLGFLPYQPQIPAIIDRVQPNSPGAKAGLRAGDQITAINSEPIKDWLTMTTIIQKHPHETLFFKLQRKTKTLLMPIEIGKKWGDGWGHVGYLGIQPQPIEWPADMQHELKYPVWIAWWPSLKETGAFTYFNAIILTKIVTGKISLKVLGGPISIFTVANEAFKQGAMVYVSFLAVLSVMLGFVNFLPIPALDGGHLLYFLIEAVRRKPLSLAAEQLGLRIGIICLLLLMVQATTNDLLRLFH